MPDGPRPLSPNIQIYRPQLTSVLSIANRDNGANSEPRRRGPGGLAGAAAEGPQPYGVVQGVIEHWVGQIFLFVCTFSFFLHLCGGIRHLVWDAGYGFELGSIYASGWMVVGVSTALTVIAWITSRALAG